MKTYRYLVMTLALALTAALSFHAVAEDAKAAPAAPAAKPADGGAAHAGVKAEVAGKLAAKKVKNRKGEEVDGFTITVSSAKGEDGKSIDTLKGKELRVGGKAVTNLASFAGKDVTITGTVMGDKAVRAESIK